MKAFLGIKEAPKDLNQDKKKGKTDLDAIHKRKIEKQKLEMKETLDELILVSKDKKKT